MKMAEKPKEVPVGYGSAICSVNMFPKRCKFCSLAIATESGHCDVLEEFFIRFDGACPLQQSSNIFCIGSTQRAGNECNHIFIAIENLWADEVGPCRSNNLPEFRISSCDADFMLYLPKELPLFRACTCKYNQVICLIPGIKPLKLYLLDGSARQTWRKSVCQHESYKRGLHLYLEVDTAAAGRK
jgi:hypothetical protein